MILSIYDGKKQIMGEIKDARFVYSLTERHIIFSATKKVMAAVKENLTTAKPVSVIMGKSKLYFWKAQFVNADLECKLSLLPTERIKNKYGVIL